MSHITPKLQSTTHSHSKHSSSPRRVRLTFFASIAAFAILVILALVFFIIDLQKSATLRILVAPTYATVEIDGRTYETDSTHKFYPGTYTAKISAPGFETQEFPLALIGGEETPLYTYLLPSDGNMDIYENDETESRRLEMVGDAIADHGTTNFFAQYPVTNLLPYSTESLDDYGDPHGFRIDYGEYDDCQTDFCLKVTSYESNCLELARDYLSENGFNPDDYQILYDFIPVEKLSPDDFPPDIRQILEEQGYFD